jgi:hypothetical protein
MHNVRWLVSGTVSRRPRCTGQLQKRCTKVFEGLHKEFENDILKVLPREEPWWASASEQDLDNSPSATGEGQDWHFFFETLEFAQEPGLHEPGVDEYRALEQY